MVAKLKMNQNQNLQIKLSQLNMAMRHVLRNRMQKQAGTVMDVRKATPEEDEIAKLKKIRDSYGLWDILKGVGIGGLTGAGLGTGAAVGADMMFNNGALPNGLYDLQQQTGNGLLPWEAGGLGSVAGGIIGAINHAQKRQRAIERLKELGIEDTIGK